MHVVDHEPSAWFLLQEEEHYFLDVFCERGIMCFCVDMQLTHEEREGYAREGRAFVMALADQVLARSDPSDPRDLRDPELQDRIRSAIAAWNQQHR